MCFLLTLEVTITCIEQQHAQNDYQSLIIIVALPLEELHLQHYFVSASACGFPCIVAEYNSAAHQESLLCACVYA